MAKSRFSNFTFSSNDSDNQLSDPPSSNFPRKLHPVPVGKETRRRVPIFTPLYNPSTTAGEPESCFYLGDDDQSNESPLKPANSVKLKKKRLSNNKARINDFQTRSTLPDVLAFFDNLTGTFYRKLLCFGNAQLLKATVRRGLQEMLGNLKIHEGNRRAEMSYSDLKIYFVYDSLFEISWNDWPLDRIHSLDFQKKMIVFLDGTSKDPGLTSSYEVVSECSTSDKAQGTSLGLKFSEFQYMLFKLLLPNPTNGIYQHFGNGRSKEDILADCKFSNNFLFEYASAAGKYTMGFATLGYGSLQSVKLDLDPVELGEVFQYSLPLYAALLLHLHDAVNRMTNKVSLLPIPDYIRLRLVFELTVHIYFETIKSRRELSQNSGTLQDITNNLHMAVRSVILTEPTKMYFLNLREDHKCLSLLQCVFSQIRFSHTLRNYFESVW